MIEENDHLMGKVQTYLKDHQAKEKLSENVNK
jgi:hypothetical protein